MADFDDTIVLDTWNEFKQLQKETDALLAVVKGKPSKSSTAKGAGGGGTTSTKVSKKSTKKQHANKHALSLSVNSGLDKTKKLYSNNDTSRITVEILDDASPDTTPRDEYDVKAREDRMNNIKKEAQKLKLLKEKEKNVSTLSYEFEKSRVNNKLDTFYGAPGISADDVKKEQQRLSRIEEASRLKRMNDDIEVEERREYLAQDRAVLKFQSAYRGHIGRMRFTLTKRLRDMADEEDNDWIEVRDRESGDVWYYNKKTGVSQWDRPVEMHQQLANNTTLKILPNIQSRDAFDTTKGLGMKENQQHHDNITYNNQTFPSLDATMQAKYTGGKAVTGTATMGKTSDWDADTVQLNEAEINAEIDDAIGSKKLNTNGFLGPDGYFKPYLRSTVQDALLETRFDTVSTVMADSRWYESDKDPLQTEKKKRKKAGAADSALVSKDDRADPSRKAMVSVMKFNLKGDKNVNEIETAKKGSKHINSSSSSSGGGKELALQDLTFKDIDHPGIETVDQQQTMCFGCWSAGLNRSCSLHADPDRKMRPSETMLLCRNWELDVMKRRYRSEELQEVYMRKASSLKYNPKLKKFTTTIEKKHQLYRGAARMIEDMNFKKLLAVKVRRWLASFTEDVLTGHGKQSNKQQERAKLMRLKRTLFALTQVHSYTNEVVSMLPVPPITGYSYEERVKENQYLFNRHDVASATSVELINVLPLPIPKCLYKLRQYHLGIPRSIPMPRPDYSKVNNKNQVPQVQHMEANSLAGWLERLVSNCARESIQAASQQVVSFTPMPGMEYIRKTKQPPPSSIKFATLGRKPVPENLAIGGLSMEMLVYQIITTYVPPQYGNLMVMDKAAVAPGISPEVTVTFNSLLLPPVTQMYINRPIEHPLNYRRPPTITLCSLIETNTRHLFGLNRPEQTGEVESHGFRTSAWAICVNIMMETDPNAFIPSEEIVSLNTPGSNTSNTTHADLTYPFCEPSTRDNSTLDFFHLLLTGAMSASKAQVFTALTTQESGLFQKDCRTDLPMGHLVVSVYRSWAFTQKDTIEEFKTDDGISYWYHRRTSQTFWERPLYDDETDSPLLGGTILDMHHPEEPLLIHAGVEGSTTRYTQGEFRKQMLSHHETVSDATERRKNTAAAILSGKRQGKWGGENNHSDNSTASGSGDGHGLIGSGIGMTGQSNVPHQQQQMANIQSVKRGSALEDDSMTFDHRKDPHSNNNNNNTTTATNSNNSSVVSDQPQVFPEVPGLDANMMVNLTNNLTKMLSGMLTGSSTPQEMIQLGMGMGMALLSTGAPQGLADNRINPNRKDDSITDGNDATIGNQSQHTGGFFPTVTEEQYNGMQSQFNQSQVSNVSNSLPVGMSRTANEPIGVPNATEHFSSHKVLDHNEQHQQLASSTRLLDQPLTSIENARLLTVVPPTETPDVVVKQLTTEMPLNAEMAMKETIPVLIYPQLSTAVDGGPPKEVTTHGPAGKGTSYVDPSEAKSQLMVKGTDNLRRTIMPLPNGFAAAIYAKRSAKQNVDYLPQVPNLPTAKTVGRVKPRSAALDWIAVSFDPWSAGKKPLNVEFVASLAAKAEKIFVGKSAVEALDTIDALRETAVKGAYVTVDDEEGAAQARAAISKAQIMAADFKKVCSYARHGKVEEVEDLLNQSEWKVPIDYQDEQGNCMLHLVCQNGSKRMVKLCLKRGASLNLQNLSGQTPLHFAFGYGYTEVGDYMLKKGADDTIKNKDGLTCYEGLGLRELQML